MGTASSFAAYSFYRSITIDHTKAGATTDLSNFPIVVSGTYAYLATTGHGGKVQNASGFDVGFFLDSGCSTGKLNWETELYTAATGVVDYWVQIPTVSHTNDTVFYMCYGDATISTDQSNQHGVWNSFYKMVWHFPNGSTLSATDSTSNGNNGAIGTPTATTGQVDGGALFDNSTGVITMNNATLTAGKSFSVAWWENVTSNAGGGRFSFVATGSCGASAIVRGVAAINLWYAPNCGGTVSASAAPTIAASVGVWHHYVITATDPNSSTPANFTMYVDGVSSAVAASSSYNAGGGNRGAGYNAVLASPANATLDEVQVLVGVQLSADWVKAAYNNQNIPDKSAGAGGFYTVGSETAPITGYSLKGFSFNNTSLK